MYDLCIPFEKIPQDSILMGFSIWFRNPDCWIACSHWKLYTEQSGTFQSTCQSDWRQSTMIKKSWVFWSSPWQPQVFKLVLFTGFLGFGGVWGLYVRTRDLPRAMRRKLVVIGASRVLLDPIFVYRVLRAITQKHVRVRSSHTIWSTQTVF